MKSRILKLIGVGLFLLGIFIWMLGGARVGFTRDSIAETKVDEITGIEFVEYREGFEPGLEFVAAGFVLFAFSMGVAALLERKSA